MATWLTITGTLQVEVIDGDNSDAWIVEKPLDDWSETRVNDEEEAPMLYYRLPYLTADTYYQLEVTAYNGIGWAQPHGEFIFKTAPGTSHDWGYDWGVLVYGLFIRVAAFSGVFRNAFREIVTLTTSGNRVRHIVSVNMTPLPGYWDADRDRPRTRNTRPSNAQRTDIFINKPPTFSLRTSILLLASVILSPKRRFSQKMAVAPLWEWMNRRAKRLSSLMLLLPRYWWTYWFDGEGPTW